LILSVFGCQPENILATIQWTRPCTECATAWAGDTDHFLCKAHECRAPTVAKCNPGCISLWYHKRHAKSSKSTQHMLYTIALVLLIAWLLGIISSYTLGGFIYILLVVAIVLILIGLIQGKRFEDCEP
jgi:integral membrane sensor domain MASE1